jgi:hypothetical protein
MEDTETIDREYSAAEEGVAADEAFAAMRYVEDLFDYHEALLPEIHQGILQFARKLKVGKDMFPFDNAGFGRWVQSAKLDSGRIFCRPQERSDALRILDLVENGYAECPEDGGVPRKLDLTECLRARPGDIIAWAKKDQPDLFPAKPKKPKPETDGLPDDDIPDLGAKADDEKPGDTTNSDEVGQPAWVNDLTAEVQRLRGRVTELENDALTDEEKAGWLDMRRLVNVLIEEAAGPLDKATQKTIEKAMLATATAAENWTMNVIVTQKPKRVRKPKKIAE